AHVAGLCWGIMGKGRGNSVKWWGVAGIRGSVVTGNGGKLRT
nr:hypothetical protein [Tanacetum cinerariifolium]